MSLREETIDLEAEIARLEQECREKAEEIASIGTENPQREILLAEGRELDTQLAGVRWAHHDAHSDGDVPVWDEDADSITLAGLTGGEMGRLEDDVGQDSGAGTGATRTILVAEGTIDAPYINDDMTDPEAVGAVASLPISYLKWAEAKINELTTVSGNGGRRFGDWLAEAQTSENSTEDSS